MLTYYAKASVEPSAHNQFLYLITANMSGFPSHGITSPLVMCCDFISSSSFACLRLHSYNHHHRTTIYIVCLVRHDQCLSTITTRVVACSTKPNSHQPAANNLLWSINATSLAAPPIRPRAQFDASPALDSCHLSVLITYYIYTVITPSETISKLHSYVAIELWLCGSLQIIICIA